MEDILIFLFGMLFSIIIIYLRNLYFQIKDIYESNKLIEEMFKDDTSRVFKTRKEANAVRRRGDKIFYDPSLDKYYVVTPKRHKFWGT